MKKIQLRDVLYISSHIYKQVSRHRRRQFILLLVLTVIGSFAEVISLGALIPFLGALTQPEVVLEYPAIKTLLQYFNFSSTEGDLILFMTVAFSVAAVTAGIMRLLLLRVGIFLSNGAGADISTNIYERTLFQPYSIHISRSSSEIIAGITQKVSTVVRVLMSIVVVITSAGLFSAILVGLLVINPIVATISIVVLPIEPVDPRIAIFFFIKILV